MAENVKSGTEILDEFFENVDQIENVDQEIAQMLVRLYTDNKLTDINVKNELQTLRETDAGKD
jgi:hypothetical protein